MPEDAAGRRAYVENYLAGRAVLDKFSTLHVEVVPDDPQRAQTCLTHERFVPAEFPEFDAAMTSVADVVNIALAAAVAARCALSGRELAASLEAAWPLLVQGHAAPTPSLRDMIVRTRAAALARAAASALSARLAGVTANPLGVDNAATAVGAQLTTTRQEFDAAGAADLAALAPGLQCVVDAVFQEVVAVIAEAAIKLVQEAKAQEQLRLMREAAAEAQRQKEAAEAAKEAAEAEMRAKAAAHELWLDTPQRETCGHCGGSGLCPIPGRNGRQGGLCCGHGRCNGCGNRGYNMRTPRARGAK
jgi:hypothetical protein